MLGMLAPIAAHKDVIDCAVGDGAGLGGSAEDLLLSLLVFCRGWALLVRAAARRNRVHVGERLRSLLEREFP